MLKIFVVLLLLAGVAAYFFVNGPKQTSNSPTSSSTPSTQPSSTTTANSKLQTPPQQKTLQNDYHVFQSFNNCGPAAMSMTLSYFGIKKSQEELGEALRPYQVPGGNNDDKSVTLQEIADKAKEFDLVAYRRPNGTPELIKLFISYDIPVIARTWLKKDDDIGHFRIIKGYDDQSGQFIQDDSYQGKNLKYTYDDFNEIWKKFNYEYLVLVPKDKQKIAEQIIGPNLDFKTAWKSAVELSKKELEKNPDDIYARFNLSVAYYNIGDYKNSVAEYEKVESKLPFRTLWYQIEPLQAYFELENYDRVLQITENVLSNHNRAFSELYIMRGEIYKKRGDKEAAKAEFEKAVLYNKNLKAAQNALSSVE